MFSKEVVEADWFTDMPAPAQLLYIHLSMEADDDGFVTNTKIAIMNAHASADDLSILIAKNYVIPVDNKLYLLKHWRQNNYIQNDRYRQSPYVRYLDDYEVRKDGSYTLKQNPEFINAVNKGEDVSKVYPDCIQSVSKMYTQDRLGKDRLGKSKELLADEGLSNELSLDNELRKTDNNQQPKAGAQEGVGVSASPSACEDEWWPTIKEFGYLTDEEEYRRKCYPELLNYLASQYGKERVKLHLKIFVSRNEGNDKITNKFGFLKKCLLDDLREKPVEQSVPEPSQAKPAKPKLKPGEIDFEADYQARNGGRLIEDDTPHATDEDVDEAFKELFGDDYAPRKD